MTSLQQSHILDRPELQKWRELHAVTKDKPPPPLAVVGLFDAGDCGIRDFVPSADLWFTSLVCLPTGNYRPCILAASGRAAWINDKVVVRPSTWIDLGHRPFTWSRHDREHVYRLRDPTYRQRIAGANTAAGDAARNLSTVGDLVLREKETTTAISLWDKLVSSQGEVHEGPFPCYHSFGHCRLCFEMTGLSEFRDDTGLYIFPPVPFTGGCVKFGNMVLGLESHRIQRSA